MMPVKRKVAVSTGRIHFLSFMLVHCSSSADSYLQGLSLLDVGSCLIAEGVRGILTLLPARQTGDWLYSF